MREREGGDNVCLVCLITPAAFIATTVFLTDTDYPTPRCLLLLRCLIVSTFSVQSLSDFGGGREDLLGGIATHGRKEGSVGL